MNQKKYDLSTISFQDSVNDLMATIARLDSNGIKVIPENTRKPGDSPLVDSSTGPPIIDHAHERSNDSNSNTPTNNTGNYFVNTCHLF